MTTEEIIGLVAQVATEVGRVQAEREREAAWAALRERIVSGSPLAERHALDREYAAGVPCTQPHLRPCSRCIRAEAFARRGDYHGGPVVWETK